ncbi:MAG: SOS response-associated peptidase [Candidatus Puniceispirillaceae bacterium]
MCGRFTSTASPEELMRLFGVTVMDNLQPRWNVAPSQAALVITQTGLQPEAIFPAWGLPPGGERRSFLINARMETAAEKPTFREAFMHRRCLVVASGWYEWSAPKQPWHVQLSDGGVMAFGGLLLRRGDEDRFVVMTSAANGDLAAIHHRQPLVLSPDKWQGWLTGGPAVAARLCVAAPANLFNWYRVGPQVGRVAEDHPELVTPLDDAALAAETAGQHKRKSDDGKSDDRQGDLFG